MSFPADVMGKTLQVAEIGSMSDREPVSMCASSEAFAIRAIALLIS
jgi:hypothetical protein